MIKKMLSTGALLVSALVLQACGGGDSSSGHFFMVTNTNSGHVCVEDLEIKANSAEAQTAGNVLYYYFGYRGGETVANSGDVSCSRAHEIGAREPDKVVSLADYNNVLVPAYNARK